MSNELPAVRVKALAGHVAEAAGIANSRLRVGMITLKPEMKYS